jgi:hypothetical protein
LKDGLLRDLNVTVSASGETDAVYRAAIDALPR